MKDVYLINYSVKGIKTLDQLISLSFYKKTISQNPDTQDYNIKGIYGMNGSGKSGIISSVDILRNLLINSGYLNNPLAQKNLEAIINKKTGELFIEADFIANFGRELVFFRYKVVLSRDALGKFMISCEELSAKKATSKSESMETVFKVINGEIVFIYGEEKDELINELLRKTLNLLTSASVCALFFEKFLASGQNKKIYRNKFFIFLFILFAFGKKLHVYMDQSDDHRDFFIQNSFGYYRDLETNDSEFDTMICSLVEMDDNSLCVLSDTENIVIPKTYEQFERTVCKLQEFLHIFKPDLKSIEIDKKEKDDVFICNLIMVYDSYKIHAEFESTGIKKLIKLFAYLREMVHGGIVFIDEFDSNLHDVYLCALLEYLMEYGEGQLCFTTHNVGPMDVLKQHKKSIDFLSVDHKIYPWTKNGNYSPSKLYRNGMIEGSPFNVDSIDFIGVFSSDEEDE